MAMIRYEPRGFSALQDDINRLFNAWGDTESSAATASWMPPVDIHEYDNRFQLFVDLPGVDPKAIDITLDNGVLTITGERFVQAPKDDEKVVERRAERSNGRFHRRFILPDTVDAEKVKASDHNGVIEISIPKQARAHPRRIEVAA